MTSLTYITPTFAVAAALKPADFAELRDLGFKSVISNLPDGEDQAHLTGRQAAILAWRNGLTFRHIPAGKLDLFTDTVVDGTQVALGNVAGPVVAFCQSGMRSAIIWAAAAARHQPVDCVLAALSKAGFDLEFLRDEFEAQAGASTGLAIAPAALDCERSTPLDLPEASAAA